MLDAASAESADPLRAGESVTHANASWLIIHIEDQFARLVELDAPAPRRTIVPVREVTRP
jgi:hypothetical protein